MAEEKSNLFLAYPNRIERLLTILETVVLGRYTKDILIGTRWWLRSTYKRLIKTLPRHSV